MNDRLVGREMAVIFLHIPKTAGQTLYDVLDRQYRRQEIYTFHRGRHYLQASIARLAAQPEAERARYRLLRGHAPYGTHGLLPGPSSYITILRDPVDRIISLYAYIQATPHHLLHAGVAGLTLEEFVASGLTTEVENGQVRLLAGAGDELPYGAATPALLADARRHIAERFILVGLTERFDDTLLLLRARLGWPRYPVYTRQNVSRHRPARTAVPPATRRLIEAHNQLDCELYAEAREQFEALARTIPAAERERFERLNGRYRPVGQARAAARSAWRWVRGLAGRAAGSG